MKIYSVEYTYDAYIDGRLNGSRRLCATKEKALKVFEEMKDMVIKKVNKKHETDPDVIKVSEYNDEEFFSIYDEWNTWSVSITEMEVEE